jgi:hypothetical protein
MSGQIRALPGEWHHCFKFHLCSPKEEDIYVQTQTPYIVAHP